MKHLFSLCENKTSQEAGAPVATTTDEAAEGAEGEPVAPVHSSSADADATLAMVRATTAAALSKELLKLGNSKLEKAVDKEYVKIFATLSLETWIDNYDVRIFNHLTVNKYFSKYTYVMQNTHLQVASIERVVDTIMVCSTHDRTTNKYLEHLMQVCTTIDMHTPCNGTR